MHKPETHLVLVGFWRWRDATLFMDDAGGVAVAGGGGREGERLRQWWACHGIVWAAAAQRLHDGVVGAGGSGGRAVVLVRRRGGPQWRGKMTEVAGVTCIAGALAVCWGVRAVAGKAFLGLESSGASLRKGSDNPHVFGVGVWQGAGVGGAWRPPWPSSDMTSLTLAEVPRQRSLHGWTLSCSGGKGNGDGNEGGRKQRG
jgi:hypothetical protein